MNTAWLLTGSNMGTREDYLSSAKREIALQCGTVQKQSSIYETAAWGKTDQPAFLNQALEIMTPLNARQLIRRLLKIEKQLGRIREEKYGPRLIDIDILMYGDEIHQYDLLKLPHPELPNRRFALLPLAEIAGEVIHPVLQQSVFSLLADCPDTLEVKKIT
jgi:2-amino-4-hydroxy-6-hydroxymethyldihydropteridine diphosphokinase